MLGKRIEADDGIFGQNGIEFELLIGEIQFADVNVTLEAEIVPSAVLLLLSAIVTSAVGCEFKTIVKLLAPPASVVVKPEVGETVMPAVSLSVFEAETLEGFSPL